MATTMHGSALIGLRPSSRATTVAFWCVTLLFCLQMSFTAYAELRLSQVGEEFARLGFSAHFFRVELSVAKMLGVLALLLPVPRRIKEWAFAGFAINLVSAILAHLAIGEGVQAWGWAAGTLLLWGGSYVLWCRLQSSSTKQQLE